MPYAQQMAFELQPDRVEPNKWVVTTPEAFEGMLARVQQAPAVALDFETSGLDWWRRARACGLALAVWDDQVGGPICWYVPFRHATGEAQLSFDRIEPALRQIWERQDQLKVLHNLKFDEHMGLREGWHLEGPRYDTMIAARFFDENRPAKLKNRAATDLGFTEAHVWEYRQNEILAELASRAGFGKTDEYLSLYGYSQVPVQICGTYACFDVDFTLRLWAKYETWGCSSKFKRLWPTEMALTRVLCDMEEVGMPVDLAYMDWLKATVISEKARLQDEIGRDLLAQNCKAFDLGSDTELKRYLQQDLGLVLFHMTKKRQLSVDREALEHWSEHSPVIPKILEWRENDKVDSTYTTSMLRFVDDRGVLHPSFQQAGTNTGRLSCREPNFQNIPADGGKEKSVRRLFITRPGMIRLFEDYSQIELRVLAHFTKDPKLVQAYLNNEDIHTLTSMEVFGTADKEKRRDAKIINFGLSYGMTYKGFAKNAKIPESEAKAYLERFFERFAGIPTFRSRFWADCRAHDNSFTNPWGRSRRVRNLTAQEGWKRGRAERQAIGSLIQGTAAELTRESLVRIWNWIREEKVEAWVVNTVHDEIQVDVAPHEVDRTAKAMKRLMEDFDDFSPIPVLVDGEYADQHWGDKKPLPM